MVNEKNFAFYARTKYPALPFDLFNDDDEIFVFSTKGVFFDESGDLIILEGSGPDTGRRRIDQLTADDVLSLIRNSSDYLARQVKEDGTFIYGYHPCFDRPIEAYNTLRHASTTYSMIEAWEVTRDETLRAAIERSLACLCNRLIQNCRLPDDTQAAFLTDDNGEIKLGGNAVAILALTKYSVVSGCNDFLPLAQKLANGIRFMQDPVDGSFVHVLNYPDISVKERFRTIYYEGEAAFGLMRLYDITQDPALLEVVEKAFEHFLANDHWKHHDHWLSYCVNELTRYRPDERYYRFGIRNFVTYLDFVLERITTFPTLLELMMAAERMLTRIRERPEYQHLLDEIDFAKFYRALHTRAQYLLNGHFWPEFAMYYRNPERILGSFFIRHHAFRVRIDDVEHYLSGFIAYRDFLLRGGTPSFVTEEKPKPPVRPTVLNPSSIGFLMYPENPKGFVEVRKLAEKSSRKGLSVFYASYKDARIENGKLNGYAFRGGRWVQADFDIPAIIENAPPRKPAENNLFAELSAVAFLTCHKLGGKQKTLSLLDADPATREWLIPSATLSLEKLHEALGRDGEAIIKPYRSNRGRGVFRLEDEPDGTVLARTNNSVTRMDRAELQAFVEQRSAGHWMLQKYVASTTANGRAYDIRVPLFRSVGGTWQAARIYARLGAGDITSNLATGGSNHDAHAFLTDLYGENTASNLVEVLEHASKQIAEVLQRSYPFLIDALGCDFGIENGKPYLFEVNSYPGMKGCLETGTDLKSDYYATLSAGWRQTGSITVPNRKDDFGWLETIGLSCQQRGELTLVPAREIEAATEANRRLLQQVISQGENDFSSSQFLKPGMGNPAYALIRSEARRRGYKSKIVNNTHLEICDERGVVAVFSPNSPNLTCAPREVAANKRLTKAILREAGLPTPAGGTFTDYDAALKYVLQRGRPQVVKPIRGYGGIGVTTQVATEEQFRRAWERASRGKRRIVVEDFFVGDELRLIVLDGQTVAAVCRVPAYVVGDGVNSVSRLVEIKNARRAKNPLMRVYPIQQFDYLENELRLGLDFVPAHGEFVRLSTVSNVGLGGEAVSLVDVLHPSFLELAKKAFEALPGATQLGLDVIAKDFGADAFADNATIIEVNSDPAIGTPRFAAYGPPASDIATKLLDYVETRKPLCNAQVRAGAVCEPAAPCDVGPHGAPRQGNPRLQIQLLRDAAVRHGLSVKALSKDVTIVSRGGKKKLFWLGMSDRTPMAAKRASRDHEWSTRLLREAGIATPERKAFGLDDFDQAWSFADQCDGPVSIKSADSVGGYMAGTSIESFSDFQDAWSVAFATGASRIAVERQYFGKAYRLFVIENRVVAVTLRDFAGRSNERNAIANVDETEGTHPEWAQIAVRAREVFFDPYHAGIDLFAEDIRKPPQQQKWFVAGIKVNPEFFIHQFPTHGQGRDVAGTLLESLFL
ncbi:YheC/YheD family protein [Agrobacterium tumefaciens]|uniref:YheC/YheD family protein n=1 Tax=Agrobacterium tumefaciens TaxID=358 RepID=UPI002243DF2E|nr:YheC/YheD family protein [Agrobacterium tumefaciens]